jgi:hypothetical protein
MILLLELPIHNKSFIELREESPISRALDNLFMKILSLFCVIFESFIQKPPDLLALKGYFFKADHRFVVYRLYLHYFIASCYTFCFVCSAMDTGCAFSHLPLSSTDLGIYRM